MTESADIGKRFLKTQYARRAVARTDGSASATALAIIPLGAIDGGQLNSEKLWEWLRYRSCGKR